MADVKPLSQADLLETLLPVFLEQGKCFQKFTPVKARLAQVGEKVDTITKDGFETENRGKAGDYLVENQTEKRERYLIPKVQFESRHSLIAEIDDDWSEYQAAGKVLALCVDNDLLELLNREGRFSIVGKWGFNQRVEPNDYLLLPQPDHSEIWRIGRAEFELTYEPCSAEDSDAEDRDYAKFRNRVLARDGKIKRILAIDGGGVRGLISIQILKKVERIVRERTGNPDALLRDYFHLVGGTSTGSVISGLVAIGKTADEMDAIYRPLLTDVFQPELLREGFFRAKYSSAKIASAIESHFGDMTMEDIARSGIGYCAVTKRLDSGSAWPIDNNPDGRYFDADPEEGNYPNKLYPARQVIRASTAAPTFFDPEKIEFEPGKPGLFVDGGVTPHNNPAFQLFMLSTIAGYGYKWETGADKIFVLSVGTGYWTPTIDEVEKQSKELAFKNGIASLTSMMNDSRELNELIMQWIGKPTGPLEAVDRVVGDLAMESLAPEPSCSYMRYNVHIDKQWLKERLGLDFDTEKVIALRDLGAIDRLDQFADLGRVYAEQCVHADELL